MQKDVCPSMYFMCRLTNLFWRTLVIVTDVLLYVAPTISKVVLQGRQRAGEIMTASQQDAATSKKRFCGGCGTPLQDGQQYCHVCGAANDWGTDCTEPTTVSVSVEEVTQSESQPVQSIQQKSIEKKTESSKAADDSELLCSECQLPVQANQPSCSACFSELSWKEGRPLVPHVHDSDTAPVVDSWKTSIPFSLLGLFVGLPLLALATFAVMYLVGFLLGSFFFALPIPSEIAWILSILAIYLVILVLIMIYPLKVYPSYFTEKPLLKTSKVVSFANFMFGGPIFGCLWNSNLTNKNKGVSYIVFAVINVLYVLLFAVYELPYL